jgi:hypothetical protein
MPGMNKSPRVQVRSHTRAAPKNGSSGKFTSNGFGIDLAQPPIPQDEIVEQPRSSWPRGGKGAAKLGSTRRSRHPSRAVAD